jgi:hypothetical protein
MPQREKRNEDVNSSGDTLRLRTSVRNWILDLRSNENKVLKRTKCGAIFANLSFQYQAKQKIIYEGKNKNHFSH